MIFSISDQVTNQFKINNRTERENCVSTPSGFWTNYASSYRCLNYLHMLVQIGCEMKTQFHELSSHVYTHFKRRKKAFISDCVFMSSTNNKILHSSEGFMLNFFASVDNKNAFHLFNIECLLFNQILLADVFLAAAPF